MSDSPPPPRYSDRQMALILQRAAALQAVGEESRHSLEEIQQLASQVGIPGELIAQAAAELETGGKSGVLGPGTSFYTNRLVPLQVERALYPELLSIIRRIARFPGEASELAGALEWRQAAGSTIQTTITVAPAPGGTMIRVEAEHGATKVLTYLLTAIATVFSTFPALNSNNGAVILGVFAGALVTWFTVARLLWKRSARRAAERVARLRDAIAERILKG